VAEELAAERGGKKPAGSEKHMMWGEVLEFTFYVKSRRGICFLLNFLSYDVEVLAFSFLHTVIRVFDRVWRCTRSPG